MGAAVLPRPAVLFCPADRPERYAKAAAAADGVILDLEDAVAPADKPAARDAVAASTLDPATTLVRVNPVGGGPSGGMGEEHRLDLAALESGPIRTLMVAKVEDPADLDHLHEAGYTVVALCETAAGVERAFEIARHPAVAALMWGAEDLVASMSGISSRHPDGSYRQVARYARSRVLVAANAAGKVAWDTVFMDIGDLEGLRAEADDAVASGFAASACIHPSQAAVIRQAYAPTEEQLEWARAVLDEAARRPGVFRFRGRMVDEPILRQARRMVG